MSAEDIEAPASPEAPAVTAPTAKSHGKRGKRGEFPTYVPGKSCLKLGRKEHDYVLRKSGSKICRRCGSSVSKQSLERTASSKKTKKSRKTKSNGNTENVQEN